MAFIDTLIKEWPLITSAPVSAILFASGVILAMWLLFRFLYKHQIDNLKSSLDLAERQRNDANDRNDALEQELEKHTKGHAKAVTQVAMVTSNAVVQGVFNAITSDAGLRLTQDPQTVRVYGPLTEQQVAELSAAKWLVGEGLGKVEKKSGQYTLSASTAAFDLKQSYEQSKAEFDVSDWKRHQTYSVWVAACLWANRKPESLIRPDHPAYPSLQKIKSALQVGKIRSLDGSIDMKAKVTREELVRLAKEVNENPRFLE